MSSRFVYIAIIAVGWVAVTVIGFLPTNDVMKRSQDASAWLTWLWLLVFASCGCADRFWAGSSSRLWLNLRRALWFVTLSTVTNMAVLRIVDIYGAGGAVGALETVSSLATLVSFVLAPAAVSIAAGSLIRERRRLRDGTVSTKTT